MMKKLFVACTVLLASVLLSSAQSYADDVPTPPSPPTPPEAPVPPCVPTPSVPSTPPSPPGPPTSPPSEPSTPSSPSGTPCPIDSDDDDGDDDSDDDDGDDDTGGDEGDDDTGTSTPPTPSTPPTSSSGGGGSFGGGGGSGFVGGGGLISGQILGAATCAPYLLEYIWSDEIRHGPNNPTEVMKLQQFLNDVQHSALTVNGKYDAMTQGALGWFQISNGAMILQPWIDIGQHRSTYIPTFNVYKTTKWWINKVKCAESEPLTHPALP